MYRILFYEPKKEYHKSLYSMFEEIEEINDVKLTVLIIADLTEFFTFLQNTNNYPDILYINNLENGDSSVEYVISLRNNGFDGEVVFIGKDVYEVFATFNAYPTSFILEDDVSKRTLQNSFHLGYKKIKYRVKDSFFIKIKGKIISVPYGDVIYFKSNKRTISIHSLDGSVLSFYGAFKDFEKETNYKGFLRIHKSYIVNHAYIREVSTKSITMVDNIKIPIGISYYPKVRDTFMIVMKNEA